MIFTNTTPKKRKTRTNLAQGDVTLIAFAVNLAKIFNEVLTVDKNSDGKVSSGEILSLVVGLTDNLGIFSTTDYVELSKRFKTSPAFRVQLVEGFSEEFDLKNDFAEQAVESTIAAAAAIFTAAQSIVKVLRTNA